MVIPVVHTKKMTGLALVQMIWVVKKEISGLTLIKTVWILQKETVSHPSPGQARLVQLGSLAREHHIRHHRPTLCPV